MCYAEGRSLLVMHFKYSSMYLSILNALAIPSTPYSPTLATISSRCLSFRLSKCLVPAPPSSPPAYTHVPQEVTGSQAGFLCCCESGQPTLSLSEADTIIQRPPLLKSGHHFPYALLFPALSSACVTMF